MSSKISNSILTLIFVLLVQFAFAQHNFEIGGSLGSGTYIGDVGGYLPFRNDSFSYKTPPSFYQKYIKWNTPRYNLSAYLRYKISKRFAARVTLSYIHLEGHDSLNLDANKVARNLSFRTDIFEIAPTAEFNFLLKTFVSRKKSSYRRKGAQLRKDFRAFIFTGLGLAIFSPKAKYVNRVYRLRPLMTEGKKYSPITWSIPLGVGCTMTFNKKLTVGISYGYHFTGTDYLDDVSSYYAVGYKEAAGNKNQNLADLILANRTSQVQTYSRKESRYKSNLPEGKYFERFDLRGDPRNKDGYFVANISIGYSVLGKNKFYRSKSREIAGKKKIAPKKFRAKF